MPDLLDAPSSAPDVAGTMFGIAVGLTVSPASVTMTPGQTQQFVAAVSGVGELTGAVTWAASAGAITSGGLFTAPASGVAIITATSAETAGVSGVASVNITGASTGAVSAVGIQPGTTDLSGGQIVVLQAFVEGIGSYLLTVAWSILSGPGSLSVNSNNDASFTAPAEADVPQPTVIRAAAVTDLSVFSDIVLVTRAASAQIGDGGGSDILARQLGRQVQIGRIR